MFLNKSKIYLKKNLVFSTELQSADTKFGKSSVLAKCFGLGLFFFRRKIELLKLLGLFNFGREKKKKEKKEMSLLQKNVLKIF